jgi:hypothetical protein
MAIGKKIRVYDLAKEVKQDTKRIMEDLRREGADISVPSNSVSAELAEKIRLRYVPKAEVAPKRTIKVIKGSKKPDEPADVTAAPAPERGRSSPCCRTARRADYRRASFSGG